MASAVIFSSLRRRRSPSLDSFVAPVDLPNDGVLEILRCLCRDLMRSFSGNEKKAPFFMVKNCRSLIRRIEVISTLLDEFLDMGSSRLDQTMFLCFKELYLVLYRSKILIDYVTRSGKLWLLLQVHAISGHFHDIGQQLSTLLDVIPLGEVYTLSDDVREQIELLRTHSTRSRLSVVDEREKSLRLRLYGFLNEFESGKVPDKSEFYSFFVKELKVCDAKGCRAEIELLEEQIVNNDGDLEPTASTINGFVALMRYCRFLLFSFEDEEGESGKLKRRKKTKGNGLITREIRNTFVTVPKDFCCPISLDLMKDPVMVSTGQTYDRVSILRWIEEGHSTCPKTGQMLSDTKLVPNRALRNLISQWCVAQGLPYDPPENPDYSSESSSSLRSRAVMEANKATTALLVEQLDNGTPRAKTVAAREIRSLAKTGRANRSCIAEAGAIPLLNRLLSSSDASAQENSVTALLNLSIYDKNKSRIMDVPGCLTSIVDVLRNGHTTEARENAAATLFSLSAVHDCKKQIALERGAIEALARLLREGTPRGQKDAVTALFNLATHTESCSRMIESGAVMALIEALSCEGVCEESAGALALIVRQPLGAEAVAKEEMAIVGLIGMMRCGTPKGKENAVAALLELCRTGGSTTTARVVKAPALAGLLQSLLFTGTKRARRKAASLARVFQRCENNGNGASLHYGMGYVAMPVSISVPAL